MSDGRELALEKEESPAATGLQSTTPEEEEMNVTSIAELTAPWLVIQTEPVPDLVIYDLTAEPSPLEVDWAHAHLADLPIAYTYHSTSTVRVWRDDEGNWWRKAGSVVVTLDYRFNINVWHGATQGDIRRMLQVVENARDGRFLAHGWEENPIPRGNSWLFRASLPITRQPFLENWARVIAEGAAPPHENVRAQDFVIPCTEVGCSEFGKHHTSDEFEDPWVLHDAGVIGRDTVDHWVAVQKCGEWEGWRVVLQEGVYELTPTEAAGLASDLQWATATAQALNGKAA